MLDETNGARRPQPTYVQAVVAVAELTNVTARRVRRMRPHGFLALPDGSSKPWFDEHSRDLMRLLIVDPNVHSFEPRPKNFKIVIDGDQIEHTPDLRVHRNHQTAIVDIERLRRSHNEENQRLEDLPYAMAHICQKLGFHYVRLHSHVIYAQPRWANASEILRFKSVELTPESIFKTIDFLSHHNGVSTLAETQAALGGRDLGLAGLYAMVLRKIIAIEMSKPLGPQSRVSLLTDRAIHQ